MRTYIHTCTNGYTNVYTHTHIHIDSTPPGYSLFSAPRSHTGNPSKPILAGGTAFLIKEPFIQNTTAHHYSSFEYSSITLKFFQSSAHTVQRLSTTPAITILSIFFYLS